MSHLRMYTIDFRTTQNLKCSGLIELFHVFDSLNHGIVNLGPHPDWCNKVPSENMGVPGQPLSFCPREEAFYLFLTCCFCRLSQMCLMVLVA